MLALWVLKERAWFSRMLGFVVSNAMAKQEVPSSAAQRIILKVLNYWKR